MALEVHLTIRGEDYSEDLSDLFISSHSEHTTSDKKDENKYDVTLANGAGRLFGKFVPKDEIELYVVNNRKTCEGDNPETIYIFKGEVQKISADETECKIEGSCIQGGMVSGLVSPKVWPPGTPIKTIVNDLLDDFGFKGKRHIEPANNKTLEHGPDSSAYNDYHTALDFWAGEANCNWFFDEHGDFWFVPPTELRGARDVTGHVLNGETASTCIGLCTVVNVIGSSIYKPYEVGAVNPTHAEVVAQARADDETIARYGEIIAPPIVVPNADKEMCQKIANNAIKWFTQFKNIPQVTLEGIAPVVYSVVSYMPFNGKQPPLKCGEASSDIDMFPIVGLVTKRVVDISPTIGIECTLDISPNFNNQLAPQNVYEDEDVKKLYPGLDISLIPGAAILDLGKYKSDMLVAEVESKYRYSDVKVNQASLLLDKDTYTNPVLTSKIDAISEDGKIEAFPKVNGKTFKSKAEAVQYFNENGWPDIGGI